MALLPTPLAATGFTPRGRLKTRAVAGGRFGGVAGVAGDPLAQLGKFCGQGGELCSELFNLLLLSLNLADNLLDTHWSNGPVRF
jgi:hypothetical protein